MNKTEFLKDLEYQNNHRVLLWHALQLTTGKVVELGSGKGSTKYLRKYCENNKRSFETYDSDPDWARDMGSNLIVDWNKLSLTDVDVLLIDHAPGERRKVDLLRYANVAQIVVIHDTEKVGLGDYKVRERFRHYKYIAEINPDQGGAGATILSNYIDVTQLIGKTEAGYKILPYED